MMRSELIEKPIKLRVSGAIVFASKRCEKFNTVVPVLLCRPTIVFLRVLPLIACFSWARELTSWPLTETSFVPSVICENALFSALLNTNKLAGLSSGFTCFLFSFEIIGENIDICLMLSRYEYLH